ncbi:MAG: hypothetical protein JNM18_11645 [Planctomycetaceae bacterium]|nr:hypothetical protein [Planctomycetaceae bacterium]
MMRTVPTHRARCVALSWLVLLGWIDVSMAFAHPAALWEFAPYRVNVIVAHCEAYPGESRLLSELTSRLESQAAADWGAAAELRVETRPMAAAAQYWYGLEQPPLDEWVAQTQTTDDKLLIVALREQRLRVRELDLRLKHWSELIDEPLGPREWHAAQIWRAITTVFQPLTLIDDVDGQTVRLRSRAAALVDPAMKFFPLQVDDVLRPIVRAESRRGQPLIAPVEWTWLRVTNVEPGAIAAEWYSGYRSPLSGRSRGQTKTYALLARPRHAATRLTLVAQERQRPLSGYEIFAQAVDRDEAELLGVTDHLGTLTIPRQATNLVQLTVKHGDEVLVRVPLAPGTSAETRLELPDDRARLEAEGLTIGLQEQIVDLVVRRQSLIAEARASLSQDKLDEASQFVKRVQQLPPIEVFRAELRNQRQRLQASDGAVRAKIERLFRDTETVLATYVDAKELDQLERELIYKRKAK